MINADQSAEMSKLLREHGTVELLVHDTHLLARTDSGTDDEQTFELLPEGGVEQYNAGDPPVAGGPDDGPDIVPPRRTALPDPAADPAADETDTDTL
jgi:hypothetical protein